MKAVILARGRGTRMQRADPSAELTAAQRRYADSGLKAMMPIGSRPFLDYVFSALADGGVTDIGLIIGPEHEMIRDYYTALAPQRLRVSFAVQREARGTADALLAATTFIGEDDFLALNADNYYSVDVYRMLIALEGPGLPAFSRRGLLDGSNFGADRMRSFALLRISPTGSLEDIIEKPDDETFRAIAVEGGAPISMNIWRFNPGILAACREVPLSPRGEFELPEAVRYAIRKQHQRFRTVPTDSGVLDLSRQSDVREVERRLATVEPRL